MQEQQNLIDKQQDSIEQFKANATINAASLVELNDRLKRLEAQIINDN